MLLLVLISGCAPAITSFTDQTTNARIVRMNGNRLAGGLTGVELNAQQFEKDGILTYSLVVKYTGPTFIHIDPGQSLILTIDGTRYELQGRGSDQNQRQISIGLVEEKAYYHDLERDLFHRLAYAGDVEVEIRGTQKTLNRSFKKINFTNFKEFYDHYVSLQIPSQALSD